MLIILVSLDMVVLIPKEHLLLAREVPICHRKKVPVSSLRFRLAKVYGRGILCSDDENEQQGHMTLPLFFVMCVCDDDDKTYQRGKRYIPPSRGNIPPFPNREKRST